MSNLVLTRKECTASLLRSCHINSVPTTTTVPRFCKDKDTFILRQYCTHSTLRSARAKIIHSMLFKTTLRLLYIHSVLNKSDVRLQQVLIASMSRPAILNKYFTEVFTFSLLFQLLSCTHRIRKFFRNVFCFKATNHCLMHRLPLCC